MFHHVAIVLDREDNRFELYIDGALVDFDELPEDFGSKDNNVRPSMGALSRGGVGGGSRVDRQALPLAVDPYRPVAAQGVMERLRN